MDTFCHEYKDCSMTGVSQTNSYIPVKNGTCVTECDVADKDRRFQAQYFKPVQQPVEAVSPVFATSPPTTALTNSNIPRFGTVIPNRIFVGGIDFKTKEEDLQKYFCQFGVVRDTKIIRDRAEVSKGYGFVTFESTEEANKVREQEDNLYLNGKKLNIGQAIRKQQICFPKDIHIPGPPGSWVLHPGGYASFANPNGITYFSSAAAMMASLQQPQPVAHGHMMTYNGPATYQPVTAHYPSYAYQPCAGQPCNAMHVPWNPAPIAGACGQLIAPSVPPSAIEQVNVVPMAAAPTLPATGYLLPRSAVSSNPQPSVRPSEASAVQQHEKSFVPQQEPTMRMLMPANTISVSAAYVQPTAPILHSPTTVYAQPTPIRCAHPQYIGLPEAPLGQYGVMTTADAESHSAMAQTLVSSENEILTPPLTPEQQQQQQQPLPQ